VIRPEDLDPILMNAKRLSIVTLLYLLGPRRMVELVRALGISWGDLSTHIKKLEEAGYVRKKRVFTITGDKVYIELTKKGVLAYLELMRKMKKLVSDIEGKRKTMTS